MMESECCALSLRGELEQGRDYFRAALSGRPSVRAADGANNEDG